MNFFDHKYLGNHLLQLCPKVVKHPVSQFGGVEGKSGAVGCLKPKTQTEGTQMLHFRRPSRATVPVSVGTTNPFETFLKHCCDHFHSALSFCSKTPVGLEVACWPLVPKYTGSNPAEAVEFFRAKKSSARLPSERK